jgi:hypothetical protein
MSTNETEILKKYGKDLAQSVANGEGTTIQLGLENPKRLSGTRELGVIEYVANMLIRSNSLIFVSDPLNVAVSYINTLSLAIQTPQNYFHEVVNATSRSDSEKGKFYAQFMQYSVLQLDLKRIVDDSMKNLELLSQLISAIESNKDNYIFALSNMVHFYNRMQIDTTKLQPFDDFWSASINQPLFLISMDWESYNKYIEGGRIILHRRHAIPIPLSPRPSHLPVYQTGAIEPDNKFIFI